MLQAYGVLLSYYLTHNVFPNATSLDYAFVGGLSFAQALLVSPLITISTREFGTRATLLIGVILQTMALIGASFATKMWHLILSQGFCFGWGLGFLFLGSANIIPQWFSTKRSLANGISAAGVGVWGLIYNLIIGAVLPHIGVGWSYRVLAICSGFFNLISVMIVKDRNLQVRPGLNTFDWHFFRRPEYLLIVAWGFTSEIGYIILYYSLPDYANSIGLSTQQGAIVNALLSVGNALGRPLVGYFSDRIGRINITTAAMGYCALLCLLLWVFAKSFAGLCAFALLVGMVAGTFWSTGVPITAEFVSLKKLPTALSMLWMILIFPALCKCELCDLKVVTCCEEVPANKTCSGLVGEPIGLALKRNHGDIYLDTQILTGILYLAAAGCTWMLRSIKLRQSITITAGRDCPVTDERIELRDVPLSRVESSNLYGG